MVRTYRDSVASCHLVVHRSAFRYDGEMSPLSASNVTASGLDPAAFAALARSRLLQAPPGLHEISPVETGELGRQPGELNGLKSAAVLVPIVATSPLTVLLTLRTDRLSAHAGQVAFPGGKIEASDRGPLEAALREAREEIALDPALVEPLGYLEPHRTGTGYVIRPAVGLVLPGFALSPDPNEVAEVFEVPLEFLMSEANHRIESRFWRGAERRFYAMPYGERYIWGATAAIIRALYRRLFAA